MLHVRPDKRILASLFSSEDIKMRQSSRFSTASFDLKNRVLNLPIWMVDDGVYTALVCHEMGHATYTDTKKWIKFTKNNPEVFGSILNIVEDIRIDMKMKQKFPGTPKNYRKLWDFMASKEEVKKVIEEDTKMHFCDKINLYFKSNNTLSVSYENKTEEEIVADCFKLDTFQDTLDMTKRIIDYIKDNQDFKSKGGGEGEGEEGEGEMIEIDASQLTEEQLKELFDIKSVKAVNAVLKNSTEAGDDGDDGGEGSSSNSSDSSKDNGKGGGRIKPRRCIDNPVILTMGKYHDDVVIPAKETFPQLRGDLANNPSLNILESSYANYFRDTKAIIDHMVKCFEQKKAAKQWQRTMISKTGKIDSNRLYRHNLTDDIFLRSEEIRDCKSHGLMLYLDFSGSMQSLIQSVMNQAIIFARFAKFVNIPFVIYGFTCSKNNKGEYIKSNRGGNAGTLERYNLVEICNSNMRKNDFHDSLKFMYYIGAINQGGHYTYDSDVLKKVKKSNLGVFSLGGSTPLNGAMITAYEQVPKFKASNRLQKVNAIFITDGEATDGIRADSYGNVYKLVSNDGTCVCTYEEMIEAAENTGKISTLRHSYDTVFVAELLKQRMFEDHLTFIELTDKKVDNGMKVVDNGIGNNYCVMNNNFLSFDAGMDDIKGKDNKETFNNFTHNQNSKAQNRKLAEMLVAGLLDD